MSTFLVWVGILVLYASVSTGAWVATNFNLIVGVIMLICWVIALQTIITGVIMGRKKR